MGRSLYHVFLSAVSAALIFFTAFTAGAVPMSRTATPANTTSIKVGGVDYVDASAYLVRRGFKATWIERGISLRFQSATGKIDLEADKRDVMFNGLRVLMGEPAIVRSNSIYISRVDADKLFLPILSPSSVTAAPPPALRVIVIDAGHGGQDTGTQNKPLKLDEKDFTLDVANRLRARLMKQGYKIVMTRTDDRFVELPRRAEIANSVGADLFISIHFNAAAGSPAVRGSETYVMTPRYQRSTGSGQRDPSDNVANPGNVYDSWNALLGFHMHAKIMGKLDSMDRGFKRARFAVLRLVNCPGVLVEAGYLSNNEEARKIASAAYRDDIAEALAQGVQAYAVAITTTAKR